MLLVGKDHRNHNFENRSLLPVCGRQNAFGVVHPQPKISRGLGSFLSRVYELMALHVPYLTAPRTDRSQSHRVSLEDPARFRIDDDNTGPYAIDMICSRALPSRSACFSCMRGDIRGASGLIRQEARQYVGAFVDKAHLVRGAETRSWRTSVPWSRCVPMAYKWKGPATSCRVGQSSDSDLPSSTNTASVNRSLSGAKRSDLVLVV